MFQKARVTMQREMRKGHSPVHSPQASPAARNRKSMTSSTHHEEPCVGAPPKIIPAYMQVPAEGEVMARDPRGDGYLTRFWSLFGIDLPVYEAKFTPAWLKDKCYLTTGYRLNYSWTQLWSSLFHV